MSADKLVSKLNHAKEVKARKGHTRSWVALCPSHDDKSPSLCIDEADNGKVLIKCWSGCGANEVIDSVGMKYHELFPDDGYECHIKRRIKPIGYHELHLDIVQSRREKGLKQTKEDKNDELASFMALRGSV